MENCKLTRGVVYCEQLKDGRFALGLEFFGEVTSWLKKSLGYGD